MLETINTLIAMTDAAYGVRNANQTDIANMLNLCFNPVIPYTQRSISKLTSQLGYRYGKRTGLKTVIILFDDLYRHQTGSCLN